MTPEEYAESVLWGGRPLPAETRALIAAAVREAVEAERERCLGLASEESVDAEKSGDKAAMYAANRIWHRIREG